MLVYFKPAIVLIGKYLFYKQTIRQINKENQFQLSF